MRSRWVLPLKVIVALGVGAPLACGGFYWWSSNFTHARMRTTQTIPCAVLFDDANGDGRRQAGEAEIFAPWGAEVLVTGQFTQYTLLSFTTVKAAAPRRLPISDCGLMTSDADPIRVRLVAPAGYEVTNPAEQAVRRCFYQYCPEKSAAFGLRQTGLWNVLAGLLGLGGLGVLLLAAGFIWFRGRPAPAPVEAAAPPG